ncbi:tigger transposable element-derived protein 1-like [Palaemon carinicauda]|uniref:tigger transposable element-derived protein 1-like n=1 Tax=Palaemon carinicauda TaxID=392227 RepID=UPI0035B5B8CC
MDETGLFWKLPPKEMFIVKEKYHAPGFKATKIRAIILNIQVVFFLPNTTSLIQPLDQWVIKNSKVHYSRRVMARLQIATDNNPDLIVMEHWKKFMNVHCLSVVEDSFHDIRPETVNACWKRLWSVGVKDFSGFSSDKSFHESVKKIVNLARVVKVEDFEEVAEDDILELLDGHNEELLDEILAELVCSASEEDEEADERDKEEGITLEKKFAEMSQLVEELKQRAYNMDHSLVCALKFMHTMEQSSLATRTSWSR